MWWYKNWRLKRALNLLGIDLSKYHGSLDSIADQIKSSSENAQYLEEKVRGLEKTAERLESQVNIEKQEKEYIKIKAQKYSLKAKEQAVQLRRAYQEVIALILTGNNKEISRETANSLGIQRALLRQNIKQKRKTSQLSDIVTALSSGEIQNAAELLAEAIPKFAKTPMMISLDYTSPSSYHSPYISKTFKKICKISSYQEAEKIFKEDLELKERLATGKEFKRIFDRFELNFVPYLLKNKSKVATIVYATPKKISGQETRHKLFSSLAETAQNELSKFWRIYNKKIPDMPITEISK